MKIRLLILALISGSAAIAAPPAKKTQAPAVVNRVPADWLKVAAITPLGTVRIGNPNAKVKLIEYLSFTCSHCAAFSMESADVLKGQMIRSGSTSLEFRPIGRDLIDIGATLLVKCAGPKDYAGAAEEIFANQASWLPRAIRFLQEDAHRFELEAPLEQIHAGAQASGLIDLMRARGLSDARINACFATPAGLNQVVQVSAIANKLIDGTPTFFINGVKVPESGWAWLEPVLRAKGAQ